MRVMIEGFGREAHLRRVRAGGHSWTSILKPPITASFSYVSSVQRRRCQLLFHKVLEFGSLKLERKQKDKVRRGPKLGGGVMRSGNEEQAQRTGSTAEPNMLFQKACKE